VRKVPLGSAVAVGVALVAAGTVLAGNPGKETIARTPAGNARARAEVLRRADFGKGWSGGLRKPDLNSHEPCSYRPKQSDLVVVGAAESRWQRSGEAVDGQAQVLRTAAMARRDWRRTVIAPQELPCLRQAFRKLLGSRGKLVSIRRVAFPHVADRTYAFRIRARVDNGAGGTVPFESDAFALSAGRDEISVLLTAAGTARSSLHADALRLARVLAHRMHS
jgi:hypothetical protein